MIKSGRVGIYRGKKYLFTHRDPKTGKIWSDDIIDEKAVNFGMWVDPDEVKFV